MMESSLKFVPKDPVDNNPNIGINNVLMPNRRQAIIWTNADSNHWRIHAAQWGDELNQFRPFHYLFNFTT